MQHGFKVFIFPFAFLLVHLFILEVYTSHEALEFWEADPKFDTRRQKTINQSSNKNESIVNTKPKRVKKTSTTLKDKEPVKEITPKFRVTEESAANIEPDKRAREYKYQRFTPKTKKYRGKQRGRQGEDHMSTRFVSDAKLKEGKKKWWWFNSNDTDSYQLSPYSIAKQLTDITSKMNNANVTMEVLGRTAEYNDIILLKVTQKKNDEEKYFRADDSKYVDEVPEKKIIFIVHGLSVMGTDKLSVFTSSKHCSQLLSYYFEHLDKFDIFLIPMANPDGLIYAKNRYSDIKWNKNVSPQNGCAGVAVDRNFDVAWNVSRSVSTCSQRYPGVVPFSEPESRAVRDVMHRYSHKIVAYMHLHAGSYDNESFKGDAVLYPKGYIDTQTDDDKYIDLKGEIDECIKNASFRYLSVAVETLHNWYGQVFGTSVDYASTVYGIPYAMELVMQVYDRVMCSDENTQDVALEEVWKRVIDVIFNSIWKNMFSNDLK